MTTTPPATLRRRLAIAAVAAAAGGAGLAAWRWRRQRADLTAAGFWGQAFPTPDGRELAMSSLRGGPLVLNFWATWCPPCIREMPALDRFHTDHAARGWRVIGLAVDEAAAVRGFLARSPVGYPIALAGFAGIDLSRRLGNVSGGLPFTVVFGRDGDVAHRHMGETRYEQLAAWVQGIA